MSKDIIDLAPKQRKFKKVAIETVQQTPQMMIASLHQTPSLKKPVGSDVNSGKMSNKRKKAQPEIVLSGEKANKMSIA